MPLSLPEFLVRAIEWDEMGIESSEMRMQSRRWVREMARDDRECKRKMREEDLALKGTKNRSASKRELGF